MSRTQTLLTCPRAAEHVHGVPSFIETLETRESAGMVRRRRRCRQCRHRWTTYEIHASLYRLVKKVASNLHSVREKLGKIDEGLTAVVVATSEEDE